MRATEGMPKGCREAASGAGWRILAYRPTVFRPFAVNMEPLSLRRRVRFLFERLLGYTVYYLSMDGTLSGYCVVSRGGSARYGFSGALDVLVGPVFIAEAFRGRRLSALLLRQALLLQRGRYESAYAYIHKGNAPSLAAFRSVGFRRFCEASVSPVLRRLSAKAGGEYLLMKLEEELHGQGERHHSNVQALRHAEKGC